MAQPDRTRNARDDGVADEPAAEDAIAADLIAVLVAVTGDTPRILTLADGDALPAGPLTLAHRSLQAGLRDWVERRTSHPLGYVEQLYTFADRDRAEAHHAISISYLGLTLEADGRTGEATWRSWYEYFPWEDHRAGAPAMIAGEVAPRLRRWAGSDASLIRRAAIHFGLDGRPWNEELVLQRYELLYEAGLIPEASRPRPDAEPPIPGRPMRADHRRILATGIARLRAKIKYRPVVFELLPPAFTLLRLQRCVEAIAGRAIHKQNYRRLIESQALVEETGETTTDTGGRPARLVRFRGDVLAERRATGSKLPVART